MKLRERVEKMSQGPSVFFFENFFSAFCDVKKAPNFLFFFHSVWYELALTLCFGQESELSSEILALQRHLLKAFSGSFHPSPLDYTCLAFKRKALHLTIQRF